MIHTYPAGTFTLTQTAFTDQPLTIRGEGSAQTVLILPSGLDITYSDKFCPPTIEGVTLVTESLNAGTALKITGPVLPSSTYLGPQISDVTIRGLDPTVDYWTKGIHLVDVWNPTLRRVNVKGLDQPAPPFFMAVGIEFERTQVFSAEKIDVYHAQLAIKQSGETFGEGVSIRDFNLVGVNHGIDLKQGSGYVVRDGHINAFYRGITLSKSQITVDNVLIYKTHYSTADFVGIYTNVAQQLKLTSNIIDGGWQTAMLNSGTTYGIVLGQTSKSLIGGNLCTNFKTPAACIVVGSLSANNTLVNNRNDAAPAAVQINPDAGVGNYVAGNRP